MLPCRRVGMLQKGNLPDLLLLQPSTAPASGFQHNVIGPFRLRMPRRVVVSAASFSNIFGGGKSCGKCKGKGAVECPGCKGSGKNKKNGNLFERWKCYDCQGFGLVTCPSCGKAGLTPEQRGER